MIADNSRREERITFSLLNSSERGSEEYVVFLYKDASSDAPQKKFKTQTDALTDVNNG
jgi:hypothetical protein